MQFGSCMIRVLLSRWNGPLSNGQPTVEPDGKRQIETHLFTRSHMLCVCAFVCVSDIPGQRPWNLTWFNNVRVSAFCCIAHSHWHTHERRGAFVCGEGYRVERLFFFHTDWPSGPETHTGTRTPTHRHTSHTYTHMYAAISSGQYNSICLVKQAVG